MRNALSNLIYHIKLGKTCAFFMILALNQQYKFLLVYIVAQKLGSFAFAKIYSRMKLRPPAEGYRTFKFGTNFLNLFTNTVRK